MIDISSYAQRLGEHEYFISTGPTLSDLCFSFLLSCSVEES